MRIEETTSDEHRKIMFTPIFSYMMLRSNVTMNAGKIHAFACALIRQKGSCPSLALQTEIKTVQTDTDKKTIN